MIDRLHVGTRAPLSRPGGLHTVVRELMRAQQRLGLQTALIDEAYGPRRYRWTGPTQATTPDTVVHFHFAQTVSAMLSKTPVSVGRKIFHFHGPWAREGAAQGDRLHRLVAKY